MSATANPSTSVQSDSNITVGGNIQSRDAESFLQHYETSTGDVAGVLSAITEDMAHFRPLHRWDEKLFVPLIKQFAAAVRRHTVTNEHKLDFLLGCSSVEEVETQNDQHKVYRAMAHPGDIGHHLFFQRVSIMLHRMGD
jgi:hypothetical protein